MKKAAEQLRTIIATAEKLGWQFEHVESGRKHDRVWFVRDGVRRFCMASKSPGPMKGCALPNVQSSVKRVLNQRRA